MDNFKNIFFVFPVMFYYLLEAVIVGLFISIIARLFLSNIVGEVGYVQWVGIYWIVKMLFFDVFKLVTGLNVGKAMQEENEKRKQENEIQ